MRVLGHRPGWQGWSVFFANPPPATGKPQNAKTIIWCTRFSQFLHHLHNLHNTRGDKCKECVVHMLAASFELFVTTVHSTLLDTGAEKYHNIQQIHTEKMHHSCDPTLFLCQILPGPCLCLSYALPYP